MRGGPGEGRTLTPCTYRLVADTTGAYPYADNPLSRRSYAPESQKGEGCASHAHMEIMDELCPRRDEMNRNSKDVYLLIFMGLGFVASLTCSIYLWARYLSHV